jgi:UDP-glucose 4-epimerase
VADTSTDASTDGTGAAVVIGAGGFIGSRLYRRLVATGIATADHVMPGVRTVFFVAGSVTPYSADRCPERVAAHLASFRALVDELTGTQARVVLASSGGTVYDERVRPPYTERSPLAPNSTYGAAKLAMERELRTSATTGVVLRLANVYGPGQRLGTGQGVVAHWLDAAAHGRPLVVYGDPETTRDYVYVDDVVDAMVRTHLAGPLPEVLNIGSGSPVTLSALLRTVEKTVAGPLDVRFEPARGIDRRDVWLATDLAGATLGWAATTGLDDGVERTWHARP